MGISTKLPCNDIYIYHYISISIGFLADVSYLCLDLLKMICSFPQWEIHYNWGIYRLFFFWGGRFLRFLVVPDSGETQSRATSLPEAAFGVFGTAMIRKIGWIGGTCYRKHRKPIIFDGKNM